MSSLKEKYDAMLKRIKGVKDKVTAPIATAPDPNDKLGLGKTTGGRGSSAKQDALDALENE